MMSFNFPFTVNPLTYYLIGTSFCVTLIILIWLFRRYRTLKKGSDGYSEYSDVQQGVSIIVYAKNDADYLAQFLPSLLYQDYPLFEVIVVNDGSTDSTKDLISDLELHYKNLHHTYAPEGTRNVSRKKLSIMLGIKAAQYDIIINTNANCQPQSDKWLSSIMRNFVDGVDIVIGHAHHIYSDDHGLGKWYRNFHLLNEAAQYLSYAFRGKTYRGTSNNLAYRKQAFFDNKGFSHSMNLHYGDDDLFISEIATPDNTRVELAHESILLSHYYNFARAFSSIKLRYDFTARYLHTTAFAIASLMSSLYIFDFIIIAAVIAVGFLNPLNYAIAILLALLISIPQIIILRKTASILQSPRLFFCIPLFSILRPAINMLYRLKGRRIRTANFTWQR